MDTQYSFGARPIFVKIAVTLLATSCVLQTIGFATHGLRGYELAIHLAISVWGLFLAWMIFHGKNWARWLCLVLIAIAVLDLAFSPAEVRELLDRPIFQIARFSFQSLLCPTAVVFLFLPASNEWFRQHANPA